MEVKKYNPFLVITPKPKHRSKPKPEAGGLSLENKNN